MICESKKLVNLYVSVCLLVEIISVGLTVNAVLRTAAMPWTHGRHIWNTMHENHLPNLGGAKRSKKKGGGGEILSMNSNPPLRSGNITSLHVLWISGFHVRKQGFKLFKGNFIKPITSRGWVVLVLQGCSDDAPLVLLGWESILGKPMYFQVHWGKNTLNTNVNFA